MNFIYIFFEKKLVPTLLAIGNNRWLVAVRNGITLTLPFTITGSIFLIFGNLPIPGWDKIIGKYSAMLNVPVNATFGIIGLITAIGVGYYLAKEYKINSISASIISLVAFLIAQVSSDLKISSDNFGATGLFTAIIVSILSVEIINFCLKKNWVIKLPEGVPSAVSNSFVSLIPAIIIISLVWLIRVVIGFDINGFLTLLFSPLVFGLSTLPGMLILIFLISILWSCGIHGDNIFGGIVSPVFLQYLAVNIKVYSEGQLPPYITADGFYIVFMCLGGTGATLGVIIHMFRSKSKVYKSLAKMAFPPAFFGINEPIIFGFPVVFNPLMIIPFTLTPMILCTLTYLLMKFEIIGRIVMQIPWTTPPILAAYLATGGDIKATIWSAITIVIAVLVYLPFFKVAEKKQFSDELLENSKTN